MKESIPATATPSVPPPSVMGECKPDSSTKDKGEAPMDVENDEKEPGFILTALILK